LLAAGGTIVLPAADRRRDPAHWTEQVRRHGVTLWNSVPALMEMLLEFSSLGDAGGINPLRLVLLSGDWIPVTLPQRLRALHAKADFLELISLGGATEASIWSILFPIGEVEPGWNSIPYGQPMDLQTFHVLDPALRPRPRWVPGELYIGGIGVAKGYWKDPQKTRHSFVTHPRTGEILYRTGDLGRYLADGNIEFLGREDFQVKIRGHRIELGEIEAALIRHPRVREGVVAAVGEARAGRRLVAYVVHGDAADPSAEDLAAELAPFLAEKLPSYMVPVAFVALEALPLSANGKVDRQALPTPDGLQPDRAAPYQAPRDATEERLAEIWSELLGVEQVGTADNFFELGGDSIQAIQLVTRLAQVGLRVTATAVFEHQTIADLAPEVQPLEAPVADAASTPVAGNGSPALDAQTAHEDELDTEGADLSDHDLEQFLADLDLPEGDSP
ncbi:MAG: non-ribosomal peptide synthetase, partial [Acidobacteriota bacterium]